MKNILIVILTTILYLYGFFQFSNYLEQKDTIPINKTIDSIIISLLNNLDVWSKQLEIDKVKYTFEDNKTYILEESVGNDIKIDDNIEEINEKDTVNLKDNISFKLDKKIIKNNEDTRTYLQSTLFLLKNEKNIFIRQIYGNIENIEINDNVLLYEFEGQEGIIKIKYDIDNEKQIEIIKLKNTKDLGNGFILKERLDKVDLLYNGNEVYSWFYNPEVVPFFGDGGCAIFIKNIREGGIDWNGVWDQEIWDSFGKEQKKKCLNENYFNLISVSKIHNQFYKIIKTNYEGHNVIIVDIQNNKIYGDKKNIFSLYIERIAKGKSGLFVLSKGGRGNGGSVLFIDNINNEIKYLFNNTDYGINHKNYREVIDFELMINKQVKILYKGQNLEQMEIIVQL